MAWQPLPQVSLDEGDIGDLDFGSLQRRTLVQKDASYGDSVPQQADSAGQSLLPEQHSYEMIEIGRRDSFSPHIQGKFSLSETSEEFPAEPSYLPEPLQRWHGLPGWKVGVFTGAVMAVLICILNILVTVWTVAGHSREDGVSYLYTGSCVETARLDTWIHLAINVASTLLLSANTMQVVSSPTRAEVDAAHRKSKWLDIGIPSVRNLRAIAWQRIVLWVILALSSVPLHMLYNTAVFSTMTANAYAYILVTEDYLKSNATFNESFVNNTMIDNSTIYSMNSMARNGSLTMFDPDACVELYGTNYVSRARNVLLVTKSTHANNTLAAYAWGFVYEIPYSWICGSSWDDDAYADHSPICTLAQAKKGIADWKYDGNLISYCMVEEVPERCQLGMSLTIMLIVIIANAIKASVMIWMIWRLKTPTLVTVGDSIASFLDEPDPTTVGMCLSSKEDIEKKRWGAQPAKTYIAKRQHWFKAASWRRWLTCNILSLAAIGTGIGLLRMGMDHIDIHDISILYRLGFGRVYNQAIMGSEASGLVGTVLYVNIPQAIFSLLFLMFNGIFSCMVGADEWNRFAYSRRPLRVTAPIGNQRTTYYLQLPYRYALPLLVVSGVLHWLMSQSLFLAMVDVYDANGEPILSSPAVGYSCIAIFCAVIVGSAALLVAFAMGFKRYEAGIPLVGSCSAAISAACHRMPGDIDSSWRPVKWGVVDGDNEGDIGHCSFSSFDVTEPIERHLYAGCARQKVKSN